MFSYLKDKASKRIQSWQSKLLSQAGRSVLIRNVGQAIPSYTMSCFLLPKTLCQELEQLFNNYWWRSGHGTNQKGINWLGWNKMSISKSQGGLGFRDLYGFNIALLGKHIWSFIHNANSLVSRIFKARYFPHSTVLKAAKGQCGSFLWSGIWTAKEELKKGFRWVLGNRDSIVAAKDPWLRTKNNFCVDPVPFYENRNEAVSSLFMPDERKWNINLVRERFLHDDAEAILGVSIPQSDRRDKIVWTGSKDGIYNVKTGYHYWSSLRIRGTTTVQSMG